MSSYNLLFMFFFFFKQKTAYEMRISDWSSDVCSSDLIARFARLERADLMPEPKRPRALARHPGQAFCGGKAEQGRAHVHRQQQRRQRRRARVAIGREGDGNARRAQSLDRDRKSTRLNSSH